MVIKNKWHVSEILWQPSEAWITQSNLAKFTQHIGRSLMPYESLHRWSVAYPGDFWGAVWDFTGIIGEKGEAVLRETDNKGMLGVSWFPNTCLNFAENVLKGDESRLAVIEVREDNFSRKVSLGELRRLVSRAQTGLRALGVTKGDRVAGIVTNRIEGLVALLATASLGAVWTSCSPDFGAQGIVDRIGQVKPKVLVASLEYKYNGRPFDIRGNIQSICETIESVSSLITLTKRSDLAINKAMHVLSWEELCSNEPSALHFLRVPFGHPLYVLYSSGTTGAPKAIVHSVGGTLINHLKEHQLHCDVKPSDILFWYTNTAWMMYHWLVSGLASGAAILLYDGAAVLKDEPQILWRIAEETGVSHFGTSPRYLEFLMKEGWAPGKEYNLTPLRSVLSAGSPVSPEQYDWVYTHIKQDMMFASISGGSEIVGCFVMGTPIHPVRRGEITCKALGMAVDVLDERGASVMHKKGDLVCTAPFPNMPITFWGEDGDKRYHASYFEKRPGIWTHGDLAEQTVAQTVIIYGRADTTLKPGGVRIGTAEIYRVLEQIPQIKDCLVFGLPVEHDEEIVLCLVTEEGELGREQADQIREQIRTKASPRHVPKRIYSVREVPYTLNGKKVEGAARLTVMKEPVKNIGSIINAECLREYEGLLQRGYI